MFLILSPDSFSLYVSHTGTTYYVSHYFTRTLPFQGGLTGSFFGTGAMGNIVITMFLLPHSRPAPAPKKCWCQTGPSEVLVPAQPVCPSLAFASGGPASWPCAGILWQKRAGAVVSASLWQKCAGARGVAAVCRHFLCRNAWSTGSFQYCAAAGAGFAH